MSFVYPDTIRPNQHSYPERFTYYSPRILLNPFERAIGAPGNLEDQDGDEDGGIVPSCLAQALTLFSFQIQIRMKMTEMTEMMGMMGMMTRKTTMPTMMVG